MDTLTPKQLARYAYAVPHGHPPTVCAAPDCPASHYAAGLCRPHYERLRRWRSAQNLPRLARPTATPAPAEWSRRHPKTCTMTGCTRPYSARGMCRAHYEQARRNNALK